MKTEPTFETFVQTFDGYRLATDVYLPRKNTRADCAWPVVAVRTPYGRRGVLDHIDVLARALPENGVALTVQDVRGKFDSTGLGKPFVHEVADGVAFSAWLARQKWCGPRIVSYGDSYAGYTAMAMAVDNPAVGGVFVRNTTANVDHWLFDNGVFRLAQNGGWARFAWGGQELQDGQMEWPSIALETAPLSPLAKETIGSWIQPHPDLPDALSPRVMAPTFLVTGWWDVMLQGAMADWRRLPKRSRGGLLIGAADHGMNRWPGGHDPVGDEHPSIVDLVEMLLEVVRGENMEGGAIGEVQGHGWLPLSPSSDRQEFRQFPRQGANASNGPEGGSLSLRPPAWSEVVAVAVDSQALVPSLSPQFWEVLAAPVVDERDAHVRGDTLTFTGEHFVADGAILFGAVELSIECRSVRGIGQLVSTLTDVHPDGTAVCLLQTAMWIMSNDFEIHHCNFGWLGHRLEAGHRLRLVLAGSCFPQYLPPTGTSESAWTARDAHDNEIHVRLGAGTYFGIGVEG